MREFSELFPELELTVKLRDNDVKEEKKTA